MSAGGEPGRGAAGAPSLVVDPMPRLHRLGTAAAVVLPFLAFALAMALTWNDVVSPRDLAILALLYVATMLGITVGFHRLLTHGSFQTTRPLAAALAVLGSMAVQGPVISWVADHRRHHAHPDRPGDPHSPHLAAAGGIRGQLAGLWHAHAGWLLSGSGLSDPRRYAPDLLEDRDMRVIDRIFGALVIAGLAVPFALGLGFGGTVRDGLTALLWGGPVRIFLAHHVTWSVNSVCHFAGTRRFDTEDRSTNVAVLALASMGESWHHNHHAFPRSAFHGLRASELDPAGWVIRVMRRLGLAWNVVVIPPERLAERTAQRPEGLTPSRTRCASASGAPRGTRRPTRGDSTRASAWWCRDSAR
jgi:stearoyl-CoA desaturase (delta-9 desaturase)